MAKRRSSSIFADMPVGLKPIYPMDAVNQPIELYNGELELEQGTKKLSGKGIVQFEWLPRPGLRFILDLPPQNSLTPEIQEGILRLLGINGHAKVSVRGFSVSSDEGVHTTKGLIDNCEIGKGKHVTSAIFHIVNFRHYFGMGVRDEKASKSWGGRAVIEAGEWRIMHDTIQESKRIFDELKALGGFAITHVGKLERVDGKKFAVTKLGQFFETLFRYLSFCRGSWVAPILAVGFDENGDRVWEHWREWKIDRWKTVATWFNEHGEEGLSKGFPGFYQRWQDEKWKETLLLSNHWYVEANMAAGGIEGSIILSQSAFELLAWTQLVEERKVISKDGFKNLRAADQLRLLLSACDIPLEISPRLTKLRNLAASKDYGWVDGPQALTEIRNAFVHPEPQKRKKIFGAGEGAVYDAWRLSMWYLELVILRLSGYRGSYSNRLYGSHWSGEEVESVPWM